MSRKIKHGWTYMTNLATSTNGFGMVAKGDNHKLSDLLLKKKEKARRRQLFKR